MVLLVSNEAFLKFCPWHWKLKEGLKKKKKQTSSIFKNNENGGGISINNSTINQLLQTQVFIKTFGKSL